MARRLLVVLMTAVLVVAVSPVVSALPDEARLNAGLGRLGAVVDGVDAVRGELEALLHPPPDDGLPAADGVVGVLGAMRVELEGLDARLNAVFHPPPDDGHPPPDDNRVVQVLAAIRNAAAGVAATAEAGFVGHPPPDDQRVGPALEAVAAAADQIVDSVNLIGGPLG